MQDDLKSLFAYNRWANRRVLESCRALGPGQYEREPVPGWSSVRATLVHLADSSSIWARRIDGETVHADVEIINQLGLHARAAARFVETASRFTAEVTVTKV